MTDSTFPVTTGGTATTTTTTSLEYAITTATADTSNDQKGDISLVISPKLKKSFTDLAVKHCSGGSDFTSCALSYVPEAVADPGVLVVPQRFKFNPTANDVAHVIQMLLALRRIPAVAATGAAVIAVAFLLAWFASSDNPQQRQGSNALKLPASVIDTNTPSPTTTTTESCTASATDVVSIDFPA